MSDLIIEVKSNVDLVEDKRRNNSADTKQFIRVLCDDVRQFLVCMEDELSQVNQAIKERDLKCADSMKSIDTKLQRQESLRNEVNNSLLQSERKELSKVDAFREHCSALKRHIDNTGSYLRKEVKLVEGKIGEAKSLMKKSVGCSIEDMNAVDEHLD